MAGSDLLRSIIFIVLAAALVGLFIRKKIKPVILLAGILVLSTYDLLAVCNRYLTADSFQDPADTQSSLTPTAADQQIAHRALPGDKVAKQVNNNTKKSACGSAGA